MSRHLFRRDDRADVGVGTLIVFIAMVLVAALAAGVLIGTSGSLQQRAQSTGQEATQEVSSNFFIEGIYGSRPTTSDPIEDLDIHIQLSAGALPLDFSQVVIRYQNDDDVRELFYSATASTATGTTEYGLAEVRDHDDSFTSASPVLTTGDLVKIKIYDVNLANSKDVAIMMFPEMGASVKLEFVTPSSYGITTDVKVR